MSSGSVVLPDPNGPNAMHETAVAGIAAAKAVLHGPNRFDNDGIAPDAEIVALKATNTLSIELALDWILSHLLSFRFDTDSFGIRVVNMSFSLYPLLGAQNDPLQFPCSGSTIADKLQNLANQNVALVASSGNHGWDDGVAFPACSPDVVAVGGVYDADIGTKEWDCDPNGCFCTDTTGADVFLCITSAGDPLEVLAPSNRATTTGLTSGGLNATVDFGGTSAAAPYVAGTLALLFDAPKVSPVPTAGNYEELRVALRNNGVLVKDGTTEIYYRRSDALEALQPYVGESGDDLRFLSPVRLYWEHSLTAEPGSWNLYRGQLGNGDPRVFMPSCHASGLPQQPRRFDDPDVPPEGSVFYYVVTGYHSCLGEGSAGMSSDGVRRTLPSPCP